jgi:hypothetical protein
LPFVSVNSFIEDTAVLVAAAFLIVRGPLERLLANPFLSGLAFGVIAGSEAVFPNARFPYASHTLGCALITVLAGWRGGAISAIIALVASFLLGPTAATVVGIQVTITVLIVNYLPRPARFGASMAVLSIALAQVASVAIAQFFPVSQASLTSPWTIPANTFGAILLGLVIRDARTRGEAERHQKEVAEARTRAIETQLLILRGRVHPHFLYNALTSIAALCNLSPKRAARAAINLGALMRQSLEQKSAETRTLKEEMETVMTYAEIEMERFGKRLRVEVDISGCENIPVPPFSVQILVENAILHGIGRQPKGGTVRIVAREKRCCALVAVADDGVGISNSNWRTSSLHGLNILSGLIAAQVPSGGKLKIIPRPENGTLAVLRISRIYQENRRKPNPIITRARQAFAHEVVN